MTDKQPMRLIEFTQDTELDIQYVEREAIATTFLDSEVVELVVVEEEPQKVTFLFADGGKAVIGKENFHFLE